MTDLLRIRLRLIALAVLVLAAATVQGPAADVNAAAAATAGDRVYGVTVAGGQQLSDALAQLTVSRPDLTPQIVQTLDSGSIPDGAAVTRSIRAGTVIVPMTPVAMPTASPTIAAAALSTTPTFEGSITLTGFDCTSNGCVPVATLTHNAIFDLGYTTYRVTGKTSGSRTNWLSIGASGYCYIRQACSSTGSYPSGATWAQKTLIFSVPMGGKTARIIATFSAAWRGSPGSSSGYTPYFSCSSSTQTCQFTV